MFQKLSKSLKLPYTDKKGYKHIYKPKNPNADKNGYVYEHRYVAAKTNKEELKSNNVVHHIDGDKKNNKPSNLMITTREEHYKLHHKK